MTGIVRIRVDPRHAPGEWLTEAETAQWSRFRIAKRRDEWLAGRIAAKTAVGARHDIAAATSIEIAAAAEGPESGRPFYRIDGRPGPFSLSIAHSAGIALAALGDAPEERVGVDLEAVCERDAAFEAIALAPAELDLLRDFTGRERWRAVTRAWVLKEALLKAVGIGLRAPLARIALQPLAFDDGLSHRSEPMPASSLFTVSDPVRAMHPMLRDAGATVTVMMFEEGESVGAHLLLRSCVGRTAAA